MYNVSVCECVYVRTGQLLAIQKRKDYAFRRQFNEKPSSIPGCPVHTLLTVTRHKMQISLLRYLVQTTSPVIAVFDVIQKHFATLALP